MANSKSFYKFMINELSIIIPTLNEEDYLPQLLSSIVQQDFTGAFEVIVVDGQSVDNTKKVVQAFQEKIKDLSLITTKKGVSRQRNAGAKKARYATILFLDADTVLPSHFLRKLVKKIKPGEQFIGMPLILPFQGTMVDYAGVYVAYNFFWFVKRFKPLVAGMCLITTKTNHQKIGGFNEQALYAEDIDYGLRSVKNGAKYYLFSRPHLFASVRRGRQMGRRKLGLLWLTWYLKLIKNGAISNQSVHDYPYGHFQRSNMNKQAVIE